MRYLSHNLWLISLILSSCTVIIAQSQGLELLATHSVVSGKPPRPTPTTPLYPYSNATGSSPYFYPSATTAAFLPPINFTALYPSSNSTRSDDSDEICEGPNGELGKLRKRLISIYARSGYAQPTASTTLEAECSIEQHVQQPQASLTAFEDNEDVYHVTESNGLGDVPPSTTATTTPMVQKLGDTVEMDFGSAGSSSATSVPAKSFAGAFNANDLTGEQVSQLHAALQPAQTPMPDSVPQSLPPTKASVDLPSASSSILPQDIGSGVPNNLPASGSNPQAAAPVESNSIASPNAATGPSSGNSGNVGTPAAPVAPGGAGLGGGNANQSHEGGSTQSQAESSNAGSSGAGSGSQDAQPPSGAAGSAAAPNSPEGAAANGGSPKQSHEGESTQSGAESSNDGSSGVGSGINNVEPPSGAAGSGAPASGSSLNPGTGLGPASSNSGSSVPNPASESSGSIKGPSNSHSSSAPQSGAAGSGSSSGSPQAGSSASVPVSQPGSQNPPHSGISKASSNSGAGSLDSGSNLASVSNNGGLTPQNSSPPGDVRSPETESPSNGAGIIPIGSQSYTAQQSGAVVVVASHTLTKGAPAVTIASTPVSVGANNVLVAGSNTLALNQAADQTNSPAVIALGSQSYTVQPAASALILGSKTIVKGAPAVTVASEPISFGADGILVAGSSTVNANALPTGSAAIIPTEAIALGSSSYAVQRAGNSAILGSNTIIPGAPAVTVASEPVSLGVDGLLVAGSSTINLNAIPTGSLESSSAGAIAIGSSSYGVQKAGISAVLGFNTIAPGAPAITVGSEPVSLGTNGLLVAGSDTLTLAAAPTAMSSPNKADIITIASSPYTIQPTVSGFVVVGSNTISQGAPAITIASQPVSLGTNGVLMAGSETVALPSLPTTAGSMTTVPSAIVSQGGPVPTVSGSGGASANATSSKALTAGSSRAWSSIAGCIWALGAGASVAGMSWVL